MKLVAGSSGSQRVPSRRANSSAAHAQRPGALELGAHLVAEIEQEGGVERGVVEHPLRERAQRPVGALVLLVELHAEVALEQRRESEGLDAEELRGDARVEDVA